MKVSRVFFIFFLIVVFAGPSLWAQPAAPVSEGAAAKAPAVAVPVLERAQENTPDAEVESSERDPFLTWIPSKIALLGTSIPAGGGGQEASPEKPAFDPKLFKVTGIVWGIEKARAIINGGIVGVGDKVHDAEIIRIDRDGILLRFQGDEYLLKRGIIDGGNSEEEKQ